MHTQINNKLKEYEDLLGEDLSGLEGGGNSKDLFDDDPMIK